MRIGITYNLKNELAPAALVKSEFDEEFDTRDTIEAIAAVLADNGFDPVPLEAEINIIDRLREEPLDFVFNIAEGHYGRNRESHIPALLEMLKIPYTGSDALTLALTLDKTMSKKIAEYAHIPTPGYWELATLQDVGEVENRLTYPMITKPAWEGSSKGIYNSSKVSDIKELEANVDILLKKYPNQPVLVEEYMKGREITVCVVGNKPPHILGMMEIRSSDPHAEDFFYSLEVKRDWRNLVTYIAPPDIPETLYEEIRRYAIIAFREFGCRDIARMDFRISEYNKPFLLEINPLPGLSPVYADIAIMAEKVGVTYEQLILKILFAAFSRYGTIAQKEKKLRVDYEKI